MRKMIAVHFTRRWVDDVDSPVTPAYDCGVSARRKCDTQVTLGYVLSSPTCVAYSDFLRREDFYAQ